MFVIKLDSPTAPVFKQGKVYRIEKIMRSVTSKSAKSSGASNASSRNELKAVDYSFDREVQAVGGTLYMFRSVKGRWRESFTIAQLCDCLIERVA